MKASTMKRSLGSSTVSALVPSSYVRFRLRIRHVAALPAGGINVLKQFSCATVSGGDVGLYGNLLVFNRRWLKGCNTDEQSSSLSIVNSLLLLLLAISLFCAECG